MAAASPYLLLMRSIAPLLAAGVMLVSGCASQAGYLAKQGGYLLRYSAGTRDARSMIEDPSTPADTREFLVRVRDIKRFAVETVGLKDNANYTRYREIDRDHLVDVVSACDAVSFTDYMWSYPFLGRLPYKGFYERRDADAEAASLKRQGYDVIVRPVDAFSTLGFTKDPLYTFMKAYTPYQLANLIIHEQTHATLFLKDQSQFNEELASFVGEQGAFEWLAIAYGEGSPEYRAAREEKEDSDLFAALLKELAGQLRGVYSSSLSREEKLARKVQVIDAFRKRLDGEVASRFHSAAYRKLGAIPFNNAYLSLYGLYSDDVPLLRRWFTERCGGSLNRFMASMKELSGRGDVKGALRDELARS